MVPIAALDVSREHPPPGGRAQIGGSQVGHDPLLDRRAAGDREDRLDAGERVEVHVGEAARAPCGPACHDAGRPIGKLGEVRDSESRHGQQVISIALIGELLQHIEVQEGVVAGQSAPETRQVARLHPVEGALQPIRVPGIRVVVLLQPGALAQPPEDLLGPEQGMERRPAEHRPLDRDADPVQPLAQRLEEREDFGIAQRLADQPGLDLGDEGVVGHGMECSAGSAAVQCPGAGPGPRWSSGSREVPGQARDIFYLLPREPRLHLLTHLVRDLVEEVLGHREGVARGQGIQRGADVLRPLRLLQPQRLQHRLGRVRQERVRERGVEADEVQGKAHSGGRLLRVLLERGPGLGGLQVFVAGNQIARSSDAALRISIASQCSW